MLCSDHFPQEVLQVQTLTLTWVHRSKSLFSQVLFLIIYS